MREDRQVLVARHLETSARATTMVRLVQPQKGSLARVGTCSHWGTTEVHWQGGTKTMANAVGIVRTLRVDAVGS